MAERFPQASREQMFERMRDSGKVYGLSFVENPRLSNSRLALEASEFARDTGQFHAFHRRVFEAYFGEAKDIGDMTVLQGLASELGLDSDGLRVALESGQYRSRLEDGQMEGQRYGVTGTPTIIVNDRYKVVGAQPLDVMRSALREIESKENSGSDAESGTSASGRE